MSINNTNEMKIIYIWDALCGWCYGFGSVLAPFLAEHPELNVEVLSGGLFVNEDSRPISHYPDMPGINERISQVYDVAFGPAYQELLERGTEVLDSYRPAVALSVFKGLSPAQNHIAMAKAIQQAFYVDGRSLSDINTYLRIAQAYQLDVPQIKERITQAWANPEEYMAEEFARVQALQVETFPTLLLEHDGRYYSFRGALKSVERLEARLSEICSSL